MNAIFDKIEIFIENAMKYDTKTLFISEPFLEKYDITFFVREKELRVINGVIRPSRLLSVAHEINVCDAVVKLNDILLQIDFLAQKAGINPRIWSNGVFEQKSPITISENQFKGPNAVIDSEDEQIRKEIHIAQIRDEAQLYVAEQVVKSKMIYAQRLRQGNPRTAMGKSHHSLRGDTEDNDSIAMIEFDIENFIRGRHVLFRNISGPATEIRTLNKLRRFLVEYSSLVNFSAQNWFGLVFLIFDSALTTCSVKRLPPKTASVNTNERHPFLFEIPTEFKRSELLRCMDILPPFLHSKR